MPTLSEFYGIKIMMYFYDSRRRHKPHFHAFYAEYEISVALSGEAIIGDFPPKKLKLVQAWAELHQDELIANWESLCEGEAIRKIEPLR